jgi:hypothetical protein
VGSGFRTFTAGEVLTASNVQNYLMDQSVMTFGGSATRSSAIGTANFEEGMVSYLTDTDKLEVYNGTNWVSVAPTTSTPMGVLINSTSFSGVASQSINNVFSATYQNYRIVVSGNNVTGTNTLRFRLRVAGVDNSTASNYLYGAFYVATTGGTGVIASSTGNTFWQVGEFYRRTSIVTIDITNPFATDYTTFNGMNYGGDSATTQYATYGGGSTTITTSYDGFTIFPDANTITGTVRVYGYNQ